MKKLLNTLYITSENSYLALDGENIVILEDEKVKGRVPLHNLEGIVSFGYRGTSPALMGVCVERNIALCYLTPQGKFLARVNGKVRGNVVLRQKQYASSHDEQVSLDIARNCILGKIYNARWILERAIRDHGMQIDKEKVKNASMLLKDSMQLVQNAESKDQLRGYEGEAASVYFGVFDELILQQKKDFIHLMIHHHLHFLRDNLAQYLKKCGKDLHMMEQHQNNKQYFSLTLRKLWIINLEHLHQYHSKIGHMQFQTK